MDFLKNKSIKYGVVLGFALFIFFQIISYIRYEEIKHSYINGHEIDTLIPFGFPIPIYYGFGDFHSVDQLILVSMVANILIFIFLGLLLVLFYKSILIFLLKNTAFKVGAITGFILFLLIQIYSYIDLKLTQEELTHLSGINLHIIPMWGFPLPNYYGKEFVIFGIVGNIIMALVFSFIVGLISKFVWSKIAARKIK